MILNAMQHSIKRQTTALLLPLLGVLFLLAGCKAQPRHTAIRLPDQESESVILVGTASLDSLYQPPFGNWYDPNIREYSPKETAIEALEPLLEDVDITLFMGTWCEDSQREVPRFVKILQEVGYPPERVRLITMNRDKKTPQNYEKGLSIINVPTFIFYREQEEVGRIVEYPIESLESDMLKILSGAPYRHAYDWD